MVGVKTIIMSHVNVHLLFWEDVQYLFFGEKNGMEKFRGEKVRHKKLIIIILCKLLLLLN